MKKKAPSTLPCCRGKRRGFVLVSVLLLGTMLITCAVAFTWFARMQVKNASREKISMVSRSAAQVLTTAAIKGIKANTMVDYDSPLLDWFKPFYFSAEDFAACTVQITPLDDKIPLRNLFLPDGSTLRNEFRGTWEDMWGKLGHRELAYLVLDFLDEDARPKMGGAERPAHLNRQLLDISELLILEEMTPELLYGTPEALGLADYCTLWSDGKINLNVAPLHVIEVLSGMNGTLAENIGNHRRIAALTDMDGLGGIPGFPAKSRAALMNAIGFASRYFMINIEMLEDGGGTGFNVVFDKTSGTIVRWEEI